MIWSIDEGRDTRPEGVDEDGIPDPAYAASLGLVPAPIGRRIAATLVDAAVYALLALPLVIGASPRIVSLLTGAVSWYGFVNHPDFVLTLVFTAASVVLTLAFTIVQLVLHGRKGVTLGKALTGLRTVNVATLASPGFGRVLLRGVVLYASSIVPVVGPALFLASPLMDRTGRRRGWLDLVGRTWLVDATNGLDPYDVKRMRIARKTVSADPIAEQQVLPSLATPVQHGAPVAYQPGARVSAGVLGVARPHAPGEQQTVGIASSQAAQPSAPAPQQPTPSAPYRPGELSGMPDVPPVPSSPFATPSGVPSAPQLAQAGQPSVGVPTASPVAPQQVPQQAPVAPQQWQAPQAPVVPPTPPLAQPVPQPAPAQPPVAQPPAAQAPVAQAPVAQPPAAPAPAAPSVPDATIVPSQLHADDDDEDLGATRIVRPRALVLELDDGARIQLGGRVLIGRNPTLQPGEAGTLVPIPDDTRSVSKTHVAIDVEGGTIQVIDRHSTNGTAIVHGGKETRLVGGVPTRAEVGDTVLLGDRRAVISRG
ncbi:RDD family protein [Agrococcus jejuensis]|uniref:FHA domain-containing protein n=1 Tax=Agrococcus jejuensis TaxID=399736 RepID=A0A1G8BTS8_9MICO|nr:RDD family protein [Agrococcus jejuensis]SDH36706.1 FHA domain-containing protein [Agrococcus jejuensis]